MEKLRYMNFRLAYIYIYNIYIIHIYTHTHTHTHTLLYNMFTALVTHRLAVTKSTKATTWPLVLQHLATCFSSHGGVVFKSLAMVAIVANTVYLGWAADHNDSWCEGLHIFSRISVQTNKTLKKKLT